MVYSSVHFEKIQCNALNCSLPNLHIVFAVRTCLTLVDLETLERELNTLYKTIHLANFNTAVQALMLVYHISTARFGLVLLYVTNYLATLTA